MSISIFQCCYRSWLLGNHISLASVCGSLRKEWSTAYIAEDYLLYRSVTCQWLTWIDIPKVCRLCTVDSGWEGEVGKNITFLCIASSRNRTERCKIFLIFKTLSKLYFLVTYSNIEIKKIGMKLINWGADCWAGTMSIMRKSN